jgi:hypothetical protein
MYSQFMIGNMGGSTVACSQVPQNIPGAVISLGCKTGGLDVDAAFSAGIINAG